MRPGAVDSNVANLQLGDLARPQTTAGGKAEDDQVHSGVGRSSSLAAQLGQDGGHLATSENLCWIDNGWAGGFHRLISKNGGITLSTASVRRESQ
jgi:hypothetical protein